MATASDGGYEVPCGWNDNSGHAHSACGVSEDGCPKMRMGVLPKTRHRYDIRRSSTGPHMARPFAPQSSASSVLGIPSKISGKNHQNSSALLCNSAHAGNYARMRTLIRIRMQNTSNPDESDGNDPFAARLIRQGLRKHSLMRVDIAHELPDSRRHRIA